VTPFEYLSVLVSIIVGLGLSHLLTGAARLIQTRRRVRAYLPTYIWMAVLLLVQIQIWWAAYDRREDTTWTFFAFFLFLLLPICAALVSYLLVPDLEGEHQELDLRASFQENRGWFHGLLGTIAAISLAGDLVEDGVDALDLNAAFRVVFLIQALAASRVRSDRYQLINALIVLAIFCAYVGMLFVQLR
jgi:hypothetical protein